MATVQLDGKKIGTRNAFHTECQLAFGLPDYYGRNMDAWIDCLSSLREDDGMTKFKLGPDESLQIEVLHSAMLRRRAPEIFDALTECASAVNECYAEMGEKPALNLVLL
jgi:RNAse (barnase) inhibitor barstar